MIITSGKKLGGVGVLVKYSLIFDAQKGSFSVSLRFPKRFQGLNSRLK